MKKQLFAKALCVLLTVLLVVAVPAMPWYGEEPYETATTSRCDKDPPVGYGGG